MFGRSKRKDAPDQTGEARASEVIVTAATEPVLPPPPLPAPPAPPAPVVSEPAPPPAPAPPPVAAAEPAPAPSSLSQADIRARTLLADSIARMELQLSQPETAPMPAPRLVPATTNGSSTAVEALAQSVAQTASEVARALEQMSSMCAMLAERLDADREERRILTDAIARLGVTSPAAVDTPSSVLGGTIFVAPPVAEADDDVISIVEDPPALTADASPSVSMFASPPVARESEAVLVDDEESAPSTSMFASPPVAREEEILIVEEEISIVEEEISIVEDKISVVEDDALVTKSPEPVGAGMWCRDDDQWIGGVEIADFVSDNGTIRYWLRRTSDGRMLPRPFDATDLRFVRETSPADG